MTDKKKSKYNSFHHFLGKASGETITEKDVQKGLNSSDETVVKMAKNAERSLRSTKKVAKEEIYDLNSMRILSSQLNMEAFAGGDIGHMLTDSFPTLVSDVKSFFNRFSSDAPGIVLSFNPHSFIKEITKHSYMDISPLAAYVPEGLDVTYLKYASVLEPATHHASNILSGILSEYSVFLAQLINNSDVRLSTASFNNKYEAVEKERMKLNAELGSCFKHGSTVAEVNIGKVVNRNSDWEEVFKSADVLMKLINTVDRKALNKKIAECAEYLDIILAKNHRGEMVGLTPEGLRNLSAGAYNVASELEYYSAIHYKVLAYITSINLTGEHFNTVFTK